MPTVCQICRAELHEPLSKNGDCPSCRLRPRHRAVFDYIQRYGDPTVTGKTIACHLTKAEIDWIFPKISDLTNFDVRPGLGLEIMDIQQMSRYPDKHFSSFIAIHVLNHVKDDRLALKEIARVLQPGGLFLCTVPAPSATLNAPFDDVTLHYGADALAQYGVGSWRRYGREQFRSQLLEYFSSVSEFPYLDGLTGNTEYVYAAKT